MADLLKSGAAWLADQRRKHAASEVIYSRGAASSTVLATHGRSSYDMTDSAGLILRYQLDDWLIDVADLVLDGTPIVPTKGDRVTDGDRTFEVHPPPGQTVYRYTDGQRLVYRIHSQLIEDET
jgi:hypothetical protein